VHKITDKLREDHGIISLILSDISKAKYRSSARIELYTSLRTTLIAHTEFEIEHFYNKIAHNHTIDTTLRNVFDNDLSKAYKQMLNLLETIIEFNSEKEGDLDYFREIIQARIDIEEEVLFPVYEIYYERPI
jgi:hypothetical protein